MIQIFCSYTRKQFSGNPIFRRRDMTKKGMVLSPWWSRDECEYYDDEYDDGDDNYDYTDDQGQDVPWTTIAKLKFLVERWP